MITYLKNKYWSDPVAHTDELWIGGTIDLKVGDIVVPWYRIEIPELVWSHLATLVILEGARLQPLFWDGYFVSEEGDTFPGPLILMSGTMCKPYESVHTMKKVVIAEIPEDCTVDFMTLFGALVGAPQAG